MKCTYVMSIAAALAAGGMVSADHLPGTMNFENVTGSRVNQTTTEDNDGNEKHVEIGDFDEDGDLDVVIGVALSDFGERRNKLYQNDGGVLNEITDSGVIPGFNAQKVTRNAFFRDFSGDGHLDIYVINDANSHPDQIFVAQWSGGNFQSFQEDNGRLPGSGSTGAACSGDAVDFDQDGDMDVWCGNYPGTSQDQYLRNNNNNDFTTITGSDAPSDSDYTVDISSADLNGDGKIDLILSNDFGDHNKIYYNDLNGAGSNVGDFRYGGGGNGGVQDLGPVQLENAMEPGDFDGDGDVDVYWSNRDDNNDVILENTGTDGSGKVIWSEFTSLPLEVTTRASRKATVADLNDDGRPDIVVMAENNRPAILRNTTIDENISFIEWTPATVFAPDDNTYRGWHCEAFDSNGDGDNDILVGGWNDDHLFENVPSNELDEDAIGGTLPALYNLAPLAIDGHAELDEADTYTMTDEVAAGGRLNVVLNGPDDYYLSILGPGGGPVTGSNRGGIGEEEALSYPVSSAGSYGIRVTVIATGGGGSSAADIDDDGVVGFSDLVLLLAAWGPCPGCPEDVDGDDAVGFGDLVIVLAEWGPVGGSSTGDYVLEILSRNG